MTEKVPQGRTRTLTRTDRLVLAFVAPPFFGLCSFALIVYVAELLGYDLYGHIDLGIIAWVVSQLLACLLLTTALAVSAAMRVGNLASCTLLGAAAGVAAWFLIGMEVRLERGLWLVPFQYSLIGFLHGWFTCRGTNRPRRAAETTADGDETPAT